MPGTVSEPIPATAARNIRVANEWLSETDIGVSESPQICLAAAAEGTGAPNAKHMRPHVCALGIIHRVLRDDVSWQAGRCARTGPGATGIRERDPATVNSDAWN